LIFDGRSFVLSADGELTCVLPACKEAVEVVDLEIATQPSATIAEDDVPRGLPVLFHSLVLGVRDFCHKNGVPDAWLGLSGGIDSAVVACIAAEALGPGRLHTLALPSKFSDPASTESARELAGTLGASFEVKSIERLHEAIELDLKDILATDREGGTTAENLQARLRMTLLMGYANRYGGVLLNTSNKTELTLGYGTLYADLAGTVSVIGDLTKPRVYQLARWISKNVTPIPDFIIERPPSAELKDDQVDPFDYETLSPKLEDLIVGSSTTTMTEQERVSLTRRVRLAEYKRWQSGVILKVSEKAFGSGRMMPITRR